MAPISVFIIEATSDKDNKKIASSPSINIRTVANHVSNILFQMNAKNRTEAPAIVKREGLKMGVSRTWGKYFGGNFDEVENSVGL